MKRFVKKNIKHILFTALGAIIGLIYYEAVGCPSGSCAITSSLRSTMLYFGLIGLWTSWIASGGCCSGGSCDYPPKEKE